VRLEDGAGPAEHVDGLDEIAEHLEESGVPALVTEVGEVPDSRERRVTEGDDDVLVRRGEDRRMQRGVLVCDIRDVM
jgi:hypothetical protein